MLKAVASGTSEKAQAFAEKYKIGKAFGTYDELAADNEIDAVYIATPHSEHYRNTLMLLKNGKHVLCEKAFAINAKEAADMIALAKSKNLFLKEVPGCSCELFHNMERYHHPDGMYCFSIF